jgi:signal transduction histidine kinase
MPRIEPVMHPLGRRRRAPDPALLLLRSVCHELRPPMATLSSLVRALEAQPAGDRHTELARLAAEHASHAAAVLEEAAAAANGLVAPADRRQPLSRVLPAAVAVVPPERLSVTASPAAVDFPVHAPHVRQILINLLTNAVRYSPEDGLIRLRARIRRRRLQLTVADQGAPTPDLSLALRRRTPPPDAVGLGLWTVRHLVTGHGGTLRARALSPYGLAMEVNLPRRTR